MSDKPKLSSAVLREVSLESLRGVIRSSYGFVQFNRRRHTTEGYVDDWRSWNDNFNLEVSDLLERQLDVRGIPHGTLSNQQLKNAIGHAADEFEGFPLRDRLLELAKEYKGEKDYFSTDADFIHRLGWECPLDFLPESKKNFYLLVVFRAMIFGAVARALGNPTIVDVFPVIYSSEQGVGKTSTLRALAMIGKNETDIRSPLEFYNSVSGLYSMRDQTRIRDYLIYPSLGSLITELAEGDTLTRDPDNNSALKGLIDESGYSTRGMWKLRSEVIPYTGTFAITTNDPTPLSDPSGARRYLPINAVKMEDPIWNHQEDIRQMWGQAVKMYLEHDPYSQWDLGLNDPLMKAIREDICLEFTDIDPAVERYLELVLDNINAPDNYYRTLPGALADDLYEGQYGTRHGTTKLMHSTAKQYCKKYGLEYKQVNYARIPADLPLGLDPSKWIPSNEDIVRGKGFRLAGGRRENKPTQSDE